MLSLACYILELLAKNLGFSGGKSNFFKNFRNSRIDRIGHTDIMLCKESFIRNDFPASQIFEKFKERTSHFIES